MQTATIEALMTPGDVPDLLFRRPAWHARAACRGGGTADYFPIRGESTAAAMAACASCPVRVNCLDTALHAPRLVGVWGGTSLRERRMMRREARGRLSA